MPDEALLPFHLLMEKLTDIEGEISNDEEGVHSYIYQFQIEMPVELEILKTGEVTIIGSSPPLYYVDTTFKPSYHNIKFTAVKYEPEYAG